MSSHDDRCYRYDFSIREHVHDRHCRDSSWNVTCTRLEHNHAAAGCPRVSTCSHKEN